MLIPKPKEIIGQNVRLRPAQVQDAAFLLSLRTTPKKLRYLNQGAQSLTEQIRWMQQQDHDQQHIYFLVQNKETEQTLGAIRIYDEQTNPFSISIGSWVMQDGTPQKLALEALGLSVDYIHKHGYTQCHFGIHAANRSVIRFHLKLGAQILSRNDEALTLINSPQNFLHHIQQIYQVATTPLETIP